MFLPFYELPINALDVSSVLKATNAAQMNTQSADAIRGQIKRARQHGFNFGYLTSSLTAKQIAKAIGDCVYRAEWTINSYPLAAVSEAVAAAPVVKAALVDFGFGVLDGKLLTNLHFYDSFRDELVPLEEVVFDLAVHETVESFATLAQFDDAASNQTEAGADIIRDTISLIERASLPGISGEVLSGTCSINRNRVLVELTYSGTTRYWEYDVSVDGRYCRCNKLKRYDGLMFEFNHSLPITGVGA